MGTTRDEKIAALKATFEQRGISKVKLGGFDVDCVLRGKYISLEKFWSAAEKGFGFCDVIFGWDIGDELYDNAKVTGWHTGYPDTLAIVDLDTFRVIPWEEDTAAFLVDFHADDGTPHQHCPRNFFKTQLKKAEAMGLRPVMSAEYEYFFFQENAHSLKKKGFRELEPLTPGMFGYSWLRTSANSDLVHTIIDGLKDFDIEIEGIHTETGPGVYETAIRYDDGLRAADKAALFKTVLKEIATAYDLSVTFMAKVSSELPGCSGHTHISLWDDAGENNVFFDADAEHGMSQKMRHFVGGIVELMPAITACAAPNINSYKRAVPGMWSPTTASWGIDNRTTSLRAIPGGKAATRVEYRQPGADMNPYIAFGAALAAGLWGIENAVEPPEPCVGNAYGENGARFPSLPSTLHAAVEAMKSSEKARAALGEDFVDHYRRTREWEVRKGLAAVTDWELARYFELA